MDSFRDFDPQMASSRGDALPVCLKMFSLNGIPLASGDGGCCPSSLGLTWRCSDFQIAYLDCCTGLGGGSRYEAYESTSDISLHGVVSRVPGSSSKISDGSEDKIDSSGDGRSCGDSCEAPSTIWRPCPN